MCICGREFPFKSKNVLCLHKARGIFSVFLKNYVGIDSIKEACEVWGLFWCVGRERGAGRTPSAGVRSGQVAESFWNLCGDFPVIKWSHE